MRKYTCEINATIEEGGDYFQEYVNNQWHVPKKSLLSISTYDETRYCALHVRPKIPCQPDNVKEIWAKQYTYKGALSCICKHRRRRIKTDVLVPTYPLKRMKLEFLIRTRKTRKNEFSDFNTNAIKFHDSINL